MIVFISDTFHTRVKTYEHQSGIYSPHLRLIAYIIENNYVSIEDDISKMLNDNKCIGTCATCEIISNENIYYEDHIIRYLDTRCNIESLSM